MDEKKFGARVRELETSLETAPKLYLARVGLFATFGYAVYLCVLSVILGLVGGMVALAFLKPGIWLIKIGWKVAIPLLILAWSLVKALRVIMPEPEGIPLTPQLAPALFQLVHRVRTRLQVPSLERVLLTTEFNASVVQLPRFGLFGARNYLMLGLPLLQALSKDDVEAVIAHEFGHLSGNHSRFSGWIYRVVGSYVQVLESTGGNRPLEKFLNWYVPRLDAFSFPLRRRNEYEADAASAEVVGRERVAQALVNVQVRGALNPQFWKRVKAQMFHTVHPPLDLYHDWAAQVKDQAPEDASSALAEALEEKTGLEDTHPSLRDRLAKLGAKPMIETSPARSAAEELFGSQYTALVRQAGNHWSAEVAEGWKTQHLQLQSARERLRELEALRTEGPLNAMQAFEYADLSEDTNPDQDALPLFKQVLELDPHHEGARFSVARLLLHRDEEEGVPVMNALSTHENPQLRLAANALLSNYFSRKGDETAAERSLKSARDAQNERESRQRARDELKYHDRFIPHGVAAEAATKLTEDLALFPEITKAYLVQKQLAAGERPVYIVAIDLTLVGRLKADDKLLQRIVETVTLPGEAWCIRLDQNASFESPIKAVPGSLIYTRG